jgi:5'-nucleotidase (lipoprotein e(P4) family)
MQNKRLNSMILFPLALVLVFLPMRAEGQQFTEADLKILSVIYVQKAAEYRALCHQAFNMARIAVEAELRKPKRLIPSAERRKRPAVIFDIDETLLDNSPLQAQYIRDGKLFDLESFNRWILLEDAKPLPGALEFVRFLKLKGVEIFYISNRTNDVKEATIANLRKFDFPDATPERVLLASRNGETKEPRRDSIRANHRVIMYVGDDLGDMGEMFERKSVADRFAAVDERRDLWGTLYVVLPNPMYGAWENAIYNYRQLPAEERNRLRLEAMISIEQR